MQEKSVAAFLEAFPFIDPGNFCNAYGMAEAVAGITGQTMENGKVHRIIPSGICNTGDKVQFLEEGDSFGRSCYAVGPSVLPLKEGLRIHESLSLILRHSKNSLIIMLEKFGLVVRVWEGGILVGQKLRMQLYSRISQVPI